MATETGSSNNGFLYFIVGILLVVVIGVGFYVYNGHGGGSSNAVERSANAVGDAAQKVGNSVSNAAKKPG